MHRATSKISTQQRERDFTRAGCAEVLIDAGAVVAPSVCESILQSRARGLLALFRRKGVLPRTLEFLAASILHHLVFLPEPYESMQFLIDRGIDTTIRDYRWDSSAVGWARYGKGDETMARWLEEAGRQRETKR